MNKSIAVIAFLCMVFSSYTLAQEPMDCATTPPEGEEIDLEQYGGIYITAEQELKVLVVFARFRDDTDPHPYWPVGSDPDDYATYLDPDIQTNSTHYINLTHYFKKMSLGTFSVIGQAVSVETPQDRSHYFSLPNPRFEANKDVLQNAVDPLINFADFDNWTYDAPYRHRNDPDGTVDMIVMIWRNRQFDTWGGEASLGYGGSFTVENGTKTVATGYRAYAQPGSGVTVHFWGERPPQNMFKAGVHELGHWLVGGSHPYGAVTHVNWGMLTGGGDGICANTYERERVAWVYPTVISGDILNAPFLDYVEYGTAYKYHPPNGGTNEYYYFENHQKLHIYDNATANPSDKGIFVIHQLGPYNNSDNIRVKTSNGQWDWENPFSISCFEGVTVPAFRKTTVNRYGLNNRDRLPTAGGGQFLFALINSSGVTECGDWLHGTGLDNSFGLIYNDVFSPYSNPYTHTWNGVPNNFAMEIFDQNGSVVNARFYLTDPLAGKPSKPQDLRATVYQPNPWVRILRLTWAPNLEDDVINGGSFQIYRRIRDHRVYPITWTAWSYLTAVPGSQTQYDDNSIAGAGTGTDSVQYYIRAKDNTNKTSVPSDFAAINFTAGVEKNGNPEGGPTPPTVFMLAQNYPNPFNPATTLSYMVPEDVHVLLRVFDLLGREVVTLVNEDQKAGQYDVQLDASQLASGVYLYKLQAGTFTDIKRMVLLK